LRSRDLGGCSKVKRIVLDTSVLVEYILSRSPYRPKVISLLNRAMSGELKLFINTITLSEVLYVASRIYRAAGLEDPNMEALHFVEWIKGRADVVNIDEGIAMRTGELKKQLRIALPDCYVISTAESMDAAPLFKKQESEMTPIVNILEKLGVLFLDNVRIDEL
jgi:predicted nucleic acid-binding protein